MIAYNLSKANKQETDFCFHFSTEMQHFIFCLTFCTFISLINSTFHREVIKCSIDVLVCRP